MVPQQVSSPVPTSQRPINGAMAGGGALLGDALARLLLVGLVPAEVVPILAPIAGVAVSGTMATVGDAARTQLIERPPRTFLGRVLFGALARVG